MKLLVTGGAGYIGSVVVQQLLAEGHTVEVLDNLTTGHAGLDLPGCVWHFGEISEAGTVLDPSFDGVVHLAAKSLVGESVEHPERYWHGNIVASLQLLDAVRTAGVKRFVFSSTAAVYGEPGVEQITEDTPTSPTNPYGASKLAIDHMLTAEAAAHGLAAVSLRYFNVAGASGALRERHDPETHLIPNLLKVAAGESPEAKIFGTDYPTRDGTAIRDYIHVVDLAEAHLRALEAAQSGEHAIYNLGTGTGTTVREILDAVREVSGSEVPAVEHPRRPGDPAVLVASGDRAARELGWRPTRSITQMVSDAWQALQNT
ncbi:UDP-glucose 4-epimerase GalE [Nesterenkonia alkaliphila]|uniref:UDP-glucose 4-epimerase n=1 Tax=Nesterenkonia alkaliphila TaxID=1463631 RepID=A0A7K1ULD5_9MICC|nr:UDP-glucose 4-epimerase GalE [Nesterenkonia alkaliphila]MVT27142.1 UDP-glucose 4-epimerase GalE [Nesterenkonia alkaliphila]GFZ91238.1 UDP-glucose 4-epimerase GalE [Nesterenkonia alkaliphila]